jgi:hypothetical protein
VEMQYVSESKKLLKSSFWKVYKLYDR